MNDFGRWLSQRNRCFSVSKNETREASFFVDDNCLWLVWIRKKKRFLLPTNVGFFAIEYRLAPRLPLVGSGKCPHATYFRGQSASRGETNGFLGKIEIYVLE